MFYLILKIEREQWLSPEKLERIQEERLRKIVTHAYNNTVFYRNLFKRCGVTPRDVRTEEDLKKLEPTKKKDLQEKFNEMVATGYSKENSRVSYTAGSTGNPAMIFHDGYTMDYFVASSMVELLDTGYKPWEKVVYTKRTTWRSHFLQKIGILRAYHVLSTIPVEEQAEALKEIDGSLIASYPTLLYSIAKVVAEKNYTIRPKAIIIGGELLTPHTRAFLEEVFKTRLYETYATIEFSTIARECSHGNWHINSTQGLVEFTNDGTILVTGLINKALPLIRYEIGDVGHPKKGSCPCGRGLPMMQILEGRQGDIFLLPDGREIPPIKVWGVRLILDRNVAAKRYQIIQEEPDLFVIRVVPTENFTAELEKRVKEELVKNLGYPVTVEIERVDEIPLIDDRKLRVEICKVKKP